MRDLLGSATPRLDRFLTWWYGQPDCEDPTPMGSGHRTPRPLGEWFEVTSRWSRPVARQNRVLDAESAWTEDGKLVFWVENQGVWLWAVDPTGDDPEVYDRENTPGQPWQPTGVALSVFLVHVAVFEAIMGAQAGASAAWITSQRLDQVLSPLSPIPGAAWRWPCPMHQLYAGDGLLAMAGPNYGAGETADTAAYREVFIAGRNLSAVSYLAKIDGVDWDWASWRQ
ncbi:hypothetical protein [Actinoplanes subtropicus]|uniref:hypothetical protein n=1 Tax=Actinoplanes subtropicus TaxID=543632 RepID=UPI0012FC58D2|nr:hypothetical protein [Actinoplanes subtropicus]